jgi:RluA family pseudouridine synthase
MTTSTFARPTKIEILYEDEVLIAVNKPPGLPTQATLDKKRPHVYGLLQKLLQEKNPHAYLALHHRLDKDTSGVLIFCKDKNYNEKISDMFKRHEFEKIYFVLTEKAPCKKSWTIKNHLAEVKVPNSQRARLHSVKSGGKIAITDFKLLETYKKALLIEAKPKTGRMHQIRVHLAECGLPILGDDLYNRKSKIKVPRMMLHAKELRFRHPKTGEELKIESPLPKEWDSLVSVKI